MVTSTDWPTFAVLSAEVDENLVASEEISQESTVPWWQAKSFSILPVITLHTLREKKKA
jgi:hypothetical protein